MIGCSQKHTTNFLLNRYIVLHIIIKYIIWPRVDLRSKIEETLVNVLCQIIKQLKTNWNIGTSIEFICCQLWPGKFGNRQRSRVAKWQTNYTDQIFEASFYPQRKCANRDKLTPQLNEIEINCSFWGKKAENDVK